MPRSFTRSEKQALVIPVPALFVFHPGLVLRRLYVLRSRLIATQALTMGDMFSSVKPPVVYQTALVIMAAGKIFVWPTAAPIFRSWVPGVCLGVPLFLAGCRIAVQSKREFKRTGTPMMGPPRDKSPLHTEGAFAWTRNPMYLGISVALAGVALATNCAWHLLFPFANALIMDRYYIPLEESILEKSFGEEYRRYRKAVPRWILV